MCITTPYSGLQLFWNSGYLKTGKIYDRWIIGYDYLCEDMLDNVNITMHNLHVYDLRYT